MFVSFVVNVRPPMTLIGLRHTMAFVHVSLDRAIKEGVSRVYRFGIISLSVNRNRPYISHPRITARNTRMFFFLKSVETEL